MSLVLIVVEIGYRRWKTKLSKFRVITGSLIAKPEKDLSLVRETFFEDKVLKLLSPAKQKTIVARTPLGAVFA